MNTPSPKPKITLIIGPTAIGKSEYAINLAQKIDAEIISADAFQVYRYMDIGTAKVPLEIRQKIPHHLIDIKNPDEDYNVVEFIRLTQTLIPEIEKRKKNIIICGGTAFYLRLFSTIINLLINPRIPICANNFMLKIKPWETKNSGKN